jgi:glycosyltransferase involved in cell wall biosynthesis/predicted SAM-dependent methyltransferase
MRVAFFSPLPPSKSGIADYSQTLLQHLSPLADVRKFTAASDPGEFDIALYQVGNNAHHDFVYETALRYPGVVVMHESNLHHLIADLTIKRGDWEAYLREVEYNAGAEALVFAQRVRALEVGPDYTGIAMTRRILESARGVIVHSQFMVEELRQAGYTGPIARIPHGAWIPPADRMAYRERLGISESTQLIGAFGFLKPYKRIAESLRAFRRMVKVEPDARLILVGEEHPEFPVRQIIRSLDLAESARVLSFAPIEDFVGYMSATDIVLNLRYPTVGESSGSLLRALGLAKAVIVSDVGGFREFPDDICLKAPVDAAEEDVLFEYLNLLVSRPDIARAMGERARCYVQRECDWDLVAQRYAAFLQSVADGTEWREQAPSIVIGRAHEPDTGAVPVATEDISTWASDDPSRGYTETHMTRLQKTLAITPPGGASDRILEMGAYLQITPALRSCLGYGEVRGCYYGKLGRVDHRVAVSAAGERFECDVDLFDAEKDRYPYPDEHYSTVLCCELIEHLYHDPMFLLAEVNRILKPGGHFVLTTPNIAALRGVAAILEGYHPGFFPAYIKPAAPCEEADARHNREYTPREVHQLLENAGFTVTLLETGAFREEPKPEYRWVMRLLERYSLPTHLRGDGIYAVGRKTGPVRERYPGWLYS